MKCVKNSTNGNIIRVEDKIANNMVGNTWKYCPKEEWKSLNRIPVTEVQEVEAEKKEKTLSKKAARRQQIKEKQRQ